MATVKIVLTGPAPVRELSSELGVEPSGLPTGMPGTPVVALTRQLAAMGHRTTLITCDRDVKTERTYERDGLRVRVGPYRPRHVARDLFSQERAYLRHAIKEEGADLVHAHWTYEFAFAALESGTPALVTVRDWAPAILRYHPDPYRLVRLWMQLRILRRARSLTVTSPYLERRVGLVARRAPTLIPNAIADDVVHPTPQVGSLRSPPRLVAVNNGFSRRKNVETLLRALPRIRLAAPGTRLELVGAGYGRMEAAHRWASEHGLDAGVDFLGQTDAAGVLEVLRRADVFVHPSREESFGLVLVEAMAQGTPVVGGARSGAVPWVLLNGAAGRLTDVDDPGALAAAVVGLLDDDEERRSLARRGYDHARTLTTSAVAARYVNCYEAVAG